VIHLDATFWKLGSEVWIEATCGMVMIPPDSQMLTQIPPDALHADKELDNWVAELRTGPAGPRLKATVDETAGTARIGTIPADYEGVRLVLSVWEGHHVHWHVRGEAARALWKGKAIAEVPFEEGMHADPAKMIEVDGCLWISTMHFCMRVEYAREKLMTEVAGKVMRKGSVVSALRKLVTADPGPQYNPRPEGDAVWIGPARLRAKYHGVIAGRFVGSTWHATGAAEPVRALHNERVVAIVMPAPLLVEGGDA